MDRFYMKKISLFLILSCSTLFSMDQASEQAKKDAFVIQACLLEYHIVLKNFSIEYDRQRKTFCIESSDMQNLVQNLSEHTILRQRLCNALYNVLIKKANKKDKHFSWKISDFKTIILNFFDQTEYCLQKNIEQLKENNDEKDATATIFAYEQ